MSEHPLAVPGLTVEEQQALSDCLSILREKRERNRLRADLYDGKHAIRHVGTIIPPTYYQTAVVLGWPAKAVDLLARRTRVEGFTWADGSLPEAGMDELVRENSLISELHQGFTSALLHSVAFAVVSAGAEDDEPDALVHVRDALSATGVWNSRTRRLSCGMTVSEWETGDVAASGTGVGPTPRSFTLYLRNLTVTCRRTEGRAWRVDRSTHRLGVPMEPLPFRPRLGRPFGSSRISRPVISAYAQAVRTTIRMEGHADVFSFPQMVLLGASSDVFKNADGSIKPAWQVALGRVFALPDDEDAANPRATVQRYESASPEPHLEMLRQQAELFSGETSIPLTSLGVSTDGNPTSAESYLASREDLITEAEAVMDDWAPALSRTAARALAIKNGYDSVPDAMWSVVPRWRSPLHTSRAAAADAGAKQLASVPWLAETEVGLELLGLSRAQIDRALAERRRAQGRRLVSDLIGAARGDAG